MSDSTISLSADTTALMNSLNSVIEEISQVKDAVSTGAKVIGDSFSESAKQAQTANDSIIQSTSGIGEQILEQTKVVKDFGAEQSKVAKEITKALNTQNNQQKDANTTLSEQQKIMQKQEEEIKKVTKAVDEQTKVVKKNGSAWKMVLQGIAIKLASETIDMIKGIISTGLEAARVYEEVSARLTPLVGDIETARATFWSLNALEDETATSTDKLAKAFLDLGNNGLNNSNEQLKTYATIAHGTGQDITTLTNSVIAFSQGSYKALRQFGITAKDNGDTVSVTYKGITQEINKNSKALDSYLKDIAKNNFDGVLEQKLNTVAAASGRLENAWGTFCTKIMQSDGGFGELVILGNDFLANTLNGISEWMSDPAVTEWFHNLTKLVKDTFQGISDVWNSTAELFENVLDSMGLKMEEGTGSWKLFFSHFFQFAQIGLLELSQKVGQLWDNTIGVLNAIGEGIGSSLAGGDFFNSYEYARNQTQKEAERTAKIYKATIADIEKEITDSENRIKAKRELLAQKFNEQPVGLGTHDSENGLDFAGKKTNTGGRTKTSSEQVNNDTWSNYYQQLQLLESDSNKALEKLEMEHANKLQEFYSILAENQQVTEFEKNNALLLIEQDYLKQKQELEQEAQNFIRSLNPEEMEIMQLQDSYSTKLEMLEQFHEEQLISEETYLQTRADLIDKYNADSMAKKQNSQTEELKKSQEPYEKMADLTRSMSDAFYDLTSSMDESSNSYKALFLVQKSFAVASATVDAVKAWIGALNDPTAITWPQKLANYTSAIATTTAALSQLTSVSMHDKGGYIKPGELGIVGEYGPELIEGPASITSRRKTADLARSALTNQQYTNSNFSSSNNANVVVNLYENKDKAGTVENSEDDDSRIINIFVSDIRRGGDMSSALQNTFNLKRVGA